MEEGKRIKNDSRLSTLKSQEEPVTDNVRARVLTGNYSHVNIGSRKRSKEQSVLIKIRVN